MKIDELNTVRKISEDVLTCLNNDLKTFFNSCHDRFPYACCEIASVLLYKVLLEEGFTEFNIVVGTNSDNELHLWLENEDFIIDLTSHQFDGFNSPLILINKDKYPLNKAPYYSKTVIDNDREDWPYLKDLEPEFFDAFYNKYYKKS